MKWEIGDDAAVVSTTQGRSLVMTCDTMVDTIHFRRETMTPLDIGWKLLASNISDLAAMGAHPTYALLSVAIPSTWKMEEIKEIYQGIYLLTNHYGITIMGGDTVKTPETLTLTMTLLGEIAPGQALVRSQAKPGDIVFVTGMLGDSAAGLHLLTHHPEQAVDFPKLVQAHRRPIPSLALGQWLAGTGYRPACNDISDGLAQEAWEIAEASGVKIILDASQIPISEQAKKYATVARQDPLDWALFGGEDYQLLGTITRENWGKCKQMAYAKGFSLIAIGRVEEGSAEVELEKELQCVLLQKRGYNHFADR